MQRRTVYYSGNVQGVGFRFNTQQVAANYDVRGFVRNLPDGRVELVAEGTEAELDAFLDRVAEVMRGQIRDIQVDVQTGVESQFKAFQVRY